MPAVTARSQNYRLRQRLEEAGVGHNARIVADIPNFGVVGSNLESSKDEARFCFIGDIVVRQVLEVGDSPVVGTERVYLEGFDRLTRGYHDLRRVEISTNGSIKVKFLEGQTEVLPA